MEVRARLTAETAQFTRGFQQATQATENFSKTASRVSSAMTGLGVAAGAVGASIIAIGLQSFRAAARVDELDIAMNAVGKSTGLGYAAIRESTLAIKANGIEMDIAQKAALKFAQNQIDLTQASELARVAQDLAVISGMNSSETFNMLTHAVITGRSEVLKSVGIQKSAGQMYESFAKSIGKTAAQLTHTEKQTRF
jgi:methylphosphotriester-DNA--protein-cysteine methyltransferase